MLGKIKYLNYCVLRHNSWYKLAPKTKSNHNFLIGWNRKWMFHIGNEHFPMCHRGWKINECFPMCSCI